MFLYFRCREMSDLHMYVGQDEGRFERVPAGDYIERKRCDPSWYTTSKFSAVPRGCLSPLLCARDGGGVVRPLRRALFEHGSLPGY
jgi:hypothetical protein